MVKLGQKVRDRISGFEGIATARTEYLFGCVHVCVSPETLHNGKPVESQWFDEQRVDPTQASTPIHEVSTAADSGGPAEAPPPRSHG